MSKPADKPKRKRRLPRWSMRAMFVGIAIVCVVLAVVVRRADEQRKAAEAVRALGGVVLYEYEYAQAYGYDEYAENPMPAWLEGVLGEDLFYDVTAVIFRSNELTHRGRIVSVKPVSKNADLVILKRLPRLLGLELQGSAITDEGLQHLSQLKELQKIGLRNTEVTAAGVRRLKESLPNCRIYWDGNPDGL